MFLRLIKELIRSNRAIEDAKQSLFAHRTWGLDESFRLFDTNSNNKITAEEFTQVFADHQLEVANVERLFEILDADGSGALEFNEWAKALKPTRPYRGCDDRGYLTVEQRNLYQKAWLEQLEVVLNLILTADSDIIEKRNSL